MKQNKPSATIICDSVAPNGVRLTTFVCTFHRYVLAEVNTHRDLSRNSASSRAIPSKVMLQRVKDTPAMPISWGSNQPGMQAGAELEGDISAMFGMFDSERQQQTLPKQVAFNRWLVARNTMMITVTKLLELGLHKQVANRLLEPFNWHTAIITTTKLDNFFWQRCHKDAQPEFKALADAMQYAYYMGKPINLLPGQWHLPFIDDNTHVDIVDFLNENPNYPVASYDLLKQLSVARCARVSYLHHDGTRALDKDFDLYDKLITGMHPSPMEHQGTPCEHVPTITALNNTLHTGNPALLLNYGDTSTLQINCKYQGNFSTGWHQLRKLLPNENRLNFIPNLPGLEQQAEILKAGGKLW